MLKKVFFSDDKNTQHVHNIRCGSIKIDLWCNLNCAFVSFEELSDDRGRPRRITPSEISTILQMIQKQLKAEFNSCFIIHS